MGAEKKKDGTMKISTNGGNSLDPEEEYAELAWQY